MNAKSKVCKILTIILIISLSLSPLTLALESYDGDFYFDDEYIYLDYDYMPEDIIAFPENFNPYDVFDIYYEASAPHDGYIIRMSAECSLENELTYYENAQEMHENTRDSNRGRGNRRRGNRERFRQNENVEEIFENVFVVEELEHIYHAIADGEISEEDILFIEPDYLVFPMGNPHPSGFSSVNDPRFNEQWCLAYTRGAAAWTIPNLSPQGVVVAVIDSGLFTGHEDIDTRFVRAGRNYTGVGNATDTNDRTGHGTGVTGMIAATRGNGRGLSSIAYGATIVPLRVFAQHGSTATASMVASAIRDATNVFGAHIINLSLGSSARSAEVENAINHARSRNVWIIAAAGNSGNATQQFPAAFSNVIGVGAINRDGQRASFSTFGTGNVFVAAPGENVPLLNILATNSYRVASGTSFAAPYVTAMAALARGHNRNMTQATFETHLRNSAVPRLGGFNTRYGHGIVDVGLFVRSLTGRDFFNFTDVPVWARPSVDFLARNGIMHGTAQTQFSAARGTTRAEFITALGRMREMSGHAIPHRNDTFTDTTNGSFYSRYVAWGVSIGIINGIGNNRFAPYSPITRQDAVTILYRFGALAGIPRGTVNLNVLNQFADRGQISAHAVTPMAWAVARGHITGLSPLANLDRGAAAVLFQRFVTTNSLLRFGGVVARASAPIDITWVSTYNDDDYLLAI